jgi:hypothetical protein
MIHSDGPARAGRSSCSSNDTRPWRDPAGRRHHYCIYLVHESSIYHGGVGSGVARHLDLPDACQDFIAELEDGPDYARHPRGLLALEFVAAGRQVVGTRVGSVLEVVTEHSGIVIDPGLSAGRGLAPPRAPQGTAPTPVAPGDCSCSRPVPSSGRSDIPSIITRRL